jgi:hypothetical protein
MNHSSETACCRRDFLRKGAGGLVGGLLGFSLPSMFMRQAQGIVPTNQLYDAMIQIFLGGGPPQTDTFDAKPGSANTIFPTVALGANDVYGNPIYFTNLCTPFIDLLNSSSSYGLGMIRSLRHISLDHIIGQNFMYCYWQSPVADGYPSTIVVMNRYFQQAANATIGVPAVLCGGGIGEANDAKGSTLSTALDANSMGSVTIPQNLPATRYQLQQQMTGIFNNTLLAACPDLTGQAANAAFQQAYNITTNGGAAKAFDTSSVTPLPNAGTTDFQYNQFVSQLTLAQNLVVSGVPYVSVGFPNPDSHNNGLTTVPQAWAILGAAIPQLAKNLQATGKRVLIVMGGEFGRTPVARSDGGRDHWPYAFNWNLLSINQPKFKTTAVGNTGPNGDWVDTQLVDPIQPGTLGALCYKVMGFDVGVDSATNIPIPTNPSACPVDATMAAVNAPALMKQFGLA